MSDYAIEAEGLGKAYRVYASPARRVLEAASLGRWRGHREVWALRDLDLQVPAGMVLGVCGANGAGKSTLLHLLAGTAAPSAGRFRIGGRVTSLLELGTGFHMEMSGRDNLLASGVLLGYGRREMARRLPEIVEFSELGGRIDEPVRTYSAGMGVRLGFSIAVVLDPDVLLLDEVFAVGDVRFQKKCVERMYEFRRSNKTILFCSHSIYDLRRLCDEALWLDGGRLAARGDVVAVTGEYFASAREAPQDGAGGGTPRGADEPRVEDVRVHRAGGGEAYEVDTGESIEVRVAWRQGAGAPEELHLGVGFVREDGTVCAGVSTQFDGEGLTGRAGTTTLHLPRFPLLSGQYMVAVWLLDRGGVHRYQEYVCEKRLAVRASTQQLGVFAPEHAWSTRAEPGAGA